MAQVRDNVDKSILIITDNNRGTTVNVTPRASNSITVSAVGAQGSIGPIGPQGPAGAAASTGSLVATASISNATITFTKGDSSTFLITVNNVQNAATASYALTTAQLQSKIVTGSIEAAVNINSNLFLIKSASTNFLTVNSTGALTLQNDSSVPFLIKNLNNQSVFYVSQSGMIVLATSSIELSTPAPNGGIYFTSSSFFVGLD